MSSEERVKAEPCTGTFDGCLVEGDPDTEAVGRVVGAAALVERPSAPATVVAVARRLISATRSDRVTRRRLYRTLADLRNDASTHPPQPAAIEEQARQLLAHLESTISSVATPSS